MSDTWTAEEQAEVLEYYGLPSLAPTEWPAGDDGVSVAQGTTEDARERFETDPERLMSSLAAIDTARQRLRPDCDPLDVKDAAAMRAALASAPRAISASEDSTPMLVGNDSLASLNRSAASLPESIIPANARVDAVLARLLTASESFDPRLFLRAIHGDTPYDALVRGRDALAAAFGARGSARRDLVRHNFDRFVHAKNAAELVFKDMGARGLAKAVAPAGPTGFAGALGTAQPTRPVQSAINARGMHDAVEAVGTAHTRAHEVFGALLARRAREDAIRAQLATLSRHADVFALAGRLRSCASVGAYVAAADAYRAAKQARDDVPPRTPARRVLDAVWAGPVARSLGDVRDALRAKLRSPVFGHDVHVRVVSLLVALDAQPDPAAAFVSDRRSILTTTVHGVLASSRVSLSESPDDTAHAVQVLLSHGMDHVFAMDTPAAESCRVRSSLISNFRNAAVRAVRDTARFVAAVRSGRRHRLADESTDDEVPPLSDPLSLYGLAEDVSSLAAALATVLSTPACPLALLASLHCLTSPIWAEPSSLIPAILAEASAPHTSPADRRSLLSAASSSSVALSDALVKALWASAPQACATIATIALALASSKHRQSTIPAVAILSSFLSSLVSASASLSSHVKMRTDKAPVNTDLVAAQCVEAFCDAVRKHCAVPASALPPGASEDVACNEDATAERIIVVHGLALSKEHVLAAAIFVAAETASAASAALADARLAPRFAARVSSASARLLADATLALVAAVQMRCSTLFRGAVLHGSFDWSAPMQSAPPDEPLPHVALAVLEIVTLHTSLADTRAAMGSSLSSPARDTLVRAAAALWNEYLAVVQALHTANAIGDGGRAQMLVDIAALRVALRPVMDDNCVSVSAAIVDLLECGPDALPDVSAFEHRLRTTFGALHV